MPTLTRENHSGGDSVVLGIVSLLPISCDLVSRQYLFRDNSALNKLNQTNQIHPQSVQVEVLSQGFMLPPTEFVGYTGWGN